MDSASLLPQPERRTNVASGVYGRCSRLWCHTRMSKPSELCEMQEPPLQSLEQV